MLNDNVIDIAKNLMNRRSVTPEDEGCQEAMKDFLGTLGFNNETMVFDDTTTCGHVVAQKVLFFVLLVTPMWFLVGLKAHGKPRLLRLLK